MQQNESFSIGGLTKVLVYGAATAIGLVVAVLILLKIFI